MGMKIVYNALIKEIIDKKTKERKIKQQASLITIAFISAMIMLLVYAFKALPLGIILILLLVIIVISFIINTRLPFGKIPEIDNKEVKTLAKIHLESRQKEELDQNEYEVEYLKLIANP